MWHEAWSKNPKVGEFPMADLNGKNNGFLEPCESEDVKVSTVVTWLNVVPVFV